MDDTDWTLVDFSEPKKKAGGAKSPPVSICPQCGKPLGARRHAKCKAKQAPAPSPKGK